MSRHRIVRTMDYKDEYEEYDDLYGHSVDDDNCISPTDASQWIYDRARGQQSISAFIANHRNIEEEDEEEEDTGGHHGKTRRDSENFQIPVLGDLEQAKLMSCIDEIRSVVGDTVSEKQIVETAMKYNYDVPSALDSILNSTSTPPQEKGTIKTLNEPAVEKDSKINSFKLGSSDKNGFTATFKVPVLNLTEGCDKSNNKSRLDELIKSNLQNYKLGESPSKSGFMLPKLNISPSSDPSSKLNQFINNQLNKSGGSTGGFKIPKLSSSPNNGIDLNKVALTPLELSLKKIKEAKQAKKDDSDRISENFKKLTVDESVRGRDEGYLVDLTNALSDITVTKTEAPSTSVEKEENFFIPFIDCDRSTFLHDQNVDIVSVVQNNSIILKKSPTRFGKIICLKYRCKKVPYIKHAFNPTHRLMHFKFESKSRDDVILGHLNKFNANI